MVKVRKNHRKKERFIKEKSSDNIESGSGGRYRVITNSVGKVKLRNG